MILKFRRDRLLYDIRNLAYVEGHRVTAPVAAISTPAAVSAGAAAHLVTDIAEDGNLDRVESILDLVFSATLDMLGDLAVVDTVDVDGLPCRPDVYLIPVSEGVRVSAATLRHLHRLIHEYMVAAVLADWLSIVRPEAAIPWRDKADSAASTLRSLLLHASPGPLTRRSSPF